MKTHVEEKHLLTSKADTFLLRSAFFVAGMAAASSVLLMDPIFFSSVTPSSLDASMISVSIDDANSIAREARSPVTPVILRTPLATPSSHMMANATASLVFEMCVPDDTHKT